MRTALALLLTTALMGCSIVGDKRVAAGCQVADGVTTWYALKHGMVETNSILAGLSSGWILAIKLAFAYTIWMAFPDEPKDADRFVLGTISVLGCVPAMHNVSVIRGMR